MGPHAAEDTEAPTRKPLITSLTNVPTRQIGVLRGADSKREPHAFFMFDNVSEPLNGEGTQGHVPSVGSRQLSLAG